MKFLQDVTYTVVQDGKFISDDIMKKYQDALNYRDILGTKEGNKVNFVGFIILNKDILVSFPKQFLSNEELEKISMEKQKMKEYIDIIFCVIKKCANKKGEKYLGIKDEFESSYPFSAFYEVYNYYKKYGLFIDKREIKRFGFNGNIQWKETVQKSPIVISKNKLLFMPMVIKDKVFEYVFISKCMAYVIDNTIHQYHSFIRLNKTMVDTGDIDFDNNKLVIAELRKIKRNIFKDIQKKLIDSLINFFEKKRSGKYIQIKVYSFNLIWEELVENYLCKRFISVNKKNNQFSLSFSDKDKSIKNRLLFNKKRIYPDIRNSTPIVTYRLEPDHYVIDGDNRYIFDAKYYEDINELNYKQVAYYFLLKSYDAKIDSDRKKNNLITYNALLLPTFKSIEECKIHFNLNPKYNMDEDEFIILEQYINVQKIMRNYI